MSSSFSHHIPLADFAAAGTTLSSTSLLDTDTSAATSSRILCCQCGTLIPPNPAALCLPCLSQTTDLSAKIPKQAIVHFCRHCGRYLNPPSQWVSAALESKELLALLVKKLRGLHQVQLKEAGFVWTEPHSKRIKVKLSIQKEVMHGMLLHQSFIVEYTVANQQCDQCTRVMAEQTWRALVQVRQKRIHPRTFFYFEQLVLQHHWHQHTTQLKPVKEGMDFFFQHRTHALHLANAIQARLPATIKLSEQLISTDQQNSTTNTRYTVAVELLPICKDDLICFSSKQAQMVGGVGPLMLCYKIHSGLAFIQPWTLATVDLSVKQYARFAPLVPVATSTQLTEFYVLEVDLTGTQHLPFQSAYVQIARSSDHHVFSVRSHLGHLLNPGDTVLAYDFTTLNINHDAFDRYMLSRNGDDVVIVKKTYPKRSAQAHQRHWKLKSLATVLGNDAMGVPSSVHKEEYEKFLQEIEEDPELRSELTLYKNKEALAASSTLLANSGTTSNKHEDGPPEIPLEELLDDLDINDDFPDAASLEEGADEMGMDEDKE